MSIEKIILVNVVIIAIIYFGKRVFAKSKFDVGKVGSIPPCDSLDDIIRTVHKIGWNGDGTIRLWNPQNEMFVMYTHKKDKKFMLIDDKFNYTILSGELIKHYYTDNKIESSMVNRMRMIVSMADGAEFYIHLINEPTKVGSENHHKALQMTTKIGYILDAVMGIKQTSIGDQRVSF